MATQKTITINGRAYDAVTGLPVDSQKSSTPQAAVPKRAPQVVATPRPVAKPASKPVAKPSPSKPVTKATAPAASRGKAVSETVQPSVQRSKTLMRRAAKKPAPTQKIVRRSQPGKHMDFARSTNVAKFAPHPVVKTPAAAPTVTPHPKPIASTPADKPAIPHPAAQRALAKAHVKKQAQAKAAKPATTKDIKDAAIAKALATPKPKAKKAPKNKWVRRGAIIGASILLLLVALLAVYKFIPSVSVSIAATQAGIEARYPDFTPDGYSLDQPVTYADGEVNLKFKSNSNDTFYAINQKRSSWDSSAVLDNVVRTSAGENYTTTKERGLTIYTYDKGAAWVNGGILYTISGDAALSGDQIRRLATSL